MCSVGVKDGKETWLDSSHSSAGQAGDHTAPLEAALWRGLLELVQGKGFAVSV